jgi:O-antigen/teichoic acid export membrane protein
LSKVIVAKGATYLYIETLVGMLSGYIFWIIMSKLAAPEIIGTSSALVSLAVIFMTAATIGVPAGIQRFLAKSLSEQKLEDATVYLRASLILVSLGIIVCSTLLIIAYDWLYEVFRIDFSLIIVALVYIASSASMILFRSVIIASLKTKTLPLVAVVSGAAKFILSVVLVLVGTGALGVTIGFSFFSVIGSILLAFSIVKIFRSSSTKQIPKISLKIALKNTIDASVPSWIPTLVYSIGSHLGPILVFGSHGANEAAFYFIAFSLVTAISALMSSLFTIAYPALSAMEDGRKRFAWRTIKISLIISLPLSSSFIFYSKEVMQFFGQDYIQGSLPLGILLCSLLPYAVTAGINNLVYSYGNYRQVLAIGLGASITRTGLYFILVPFYDSTGAAASYTIGTVIGFIISIVIAKKVGVHMHWDMLAYVLVIPTGLGFAFSYFQVQYLIGIILTLAISYLLLLKLHIITRTDIQDSLAIMPYNTVNILSRVYKKVYRKNR